MDKTQPTTESNRRERVQSASQIFEELGADIRAVINYQTNNEVEAEDIFQDFFLSLVRKPVPKHVKDVRGYLRRAVVHDVIDASRKAKKYKDRLKRYSQKPSWKPERNAALHSLIQEEQIGRISQVITEELLPSERKAIKLRFLCEKSMQEAAEEMGINKRSLSRYICVGFKKVRSLLNENCSGISYSGQRPQYI